MLGSIVPSPAGTPPPSRPTQRKGVNGVPYSSVDSGSSNARPALGSPIDVFTFPVPPPLLLGVRRNSSSRALTLWKLSCCTQWLAFGRRSTRTFGTQLASGTAPSGQSFTLSPFTPPSGVGLGTVALAAVFGLLSFGGFEGAASLGEETDNPRRNIPRAIATAVITMGVFYTIVMLAQTLGFGIDKQ